MMKFLDYEGLQKFKEQADAAYLPVKGTIPLTGSINLTTESVASLGIKYAKVANNSLNFYVIADSSGKLPSSETRININSSITSLVGAEGANVGDIFVVGKLDLKPVYKVIPLNDAKAENSTYRGTQGVVTPWDKAQINKVPNMEAAINAAKNNLPTYSEGNMNNALQTGVYPWCTLGRPAGSTGAYTLLTLASTTQDSAGYTTIEQTAYGRQNDELGKVFKRIIFKKGSEVQFGDWLEITSGSLPKVIEDNSDDSVFTTFAKKNVSALSFRAKDNNSSDPELPKLITTIDSASEEFNITNKGFSGGGYSGISLSCPIGDSSYPSAAIGAYFGDNFIGITTDIYYGIVISVADTTGEEVKFNNYMFNIKKMVELGLLEEIT
nr:MAG TPA: hypothetical protein [Caudoviricetes sp.]